MAAEKEIVDHWLNKQGFSTVKNIKISNRDVGILAVKHEGNENKFYHIEISCSLTSGPSEKDVKVGIARFVNKTFNDPLIIRGVNEAIKNIAGDKKEYERILVASNLPVSKEKEIIEEFKAKNINIFKFEDIMGDIILDLDTQYYRDDVMRSLQLMKYLLLAQPDKLAMILDKKGQYSILNQKTRHSFIRYFLNQKETQKALANLDEKQLGIIIKNSILKQPDRLAKVVVEEVLGTRSKRRFLKTVVKHEKMKSVIGKKPVEAREIPSILEPKHKTLKYFFRK